MQKMQLDPSLTPYLKINSKGIGCEGDLAVTPVTPLIARVDLADLADLAGIPFLPHYSTCVPPEAVLLVEGTTFPDRGEDHASVKDIQIAPC